MGRIFSVLEKYGHHPRTHEWKMSFADIGNGSNTLKNSLGSEFLNKVDLLVEGVSLPEIVNTAIAQVFRGATYRLPSRTQKGGDLTLNFKEVLMDNVYRCHKTFTDWIDKIDSAETGIGLPMLQTRADLKLTLYKPLDNEATEFESVKLFSIVFKQSYPTAVTAVALDSKNSTDIIKIPVTFRYDWWELGA